MYRSLNKNGWLLGVEGDDILIKIDSTLDGKGFNKSIVNLKDEVITILSKLIVKRKESLYEILPKIGDSLSGRINDNFQML